MTIYRVQVKRSLASAPAIGNWNAYSTFWFDAASDFDWTDATVGNLLSRLASAAPPSGDGVGYGVYGYQTGTGSERILVYRVNGSLGLDFVVDHPRAYANYGPSSTASDDILTPAHVGLSVQYRADISSVRQRGMARFFVGPLRFDDAKVTTSGTLRMTLTVITAIIDNTVDTLEALAVLGAVAKVHSGRTSGQTWHSIEEVFCDDLFDTMRSRKAWPLNQYRVSL